jgi:hypothetical protein
VTVREIEKVVTEGKRKNFSHPKLFEFWERLELYTLRCQDAL